jgi:phosphohistidine swiveling domain-containing protein
LTSCGETIEALPWAEEKFKIKPYCVFERKNGVIYYWYDSEGIEWKKQRAGQFDKEILKKKVRETYADIKDIIEKEKALSKEDFKKFVDKLKGYWAWWDCMWWMIEYYDENKLEIEDLLCLRKEVEKLASGTVAVIRNSAARIMPMDKKYVDVLLVEEAIRGKIPSINVLKERLRECAYTDGKLFKSIAEVEDKFCIRRQQEIISNREAFTGQVAYPGLVKGRVRIIKSRKELRFFKMGEILVSSTTTPDFLPAMRKAAAIISEHGGAICHAAITARELKKPCIVGVGGITQSLKNGDSVEVDANNGMVKILKRL